MVDLNEIQNCKIPSIIDEIKHDDVMFLINAIYFKGQWESSLNEPLKAMGMGVAFVRGKADFSGMRDQNDLYISKVKHKAVVEVNEEGTEAAAATSVGIALVSAPRRFTFIADHPFLMMIRDQRTDAILFMGVVVDPK